MDGMNCLLTFDQDDHGVIPVFGDFIIDQIFPVCRYEMRDKSTSFLEFVRIIRIEDLFDKKLVWHFCHSCKCTDQLHHGAPDK